MTDKQLDQAEQQLRDEMRAQGYGWIDGKWVKPPQEYILREKELSCISMINSILAYQGAGIADAEEVMRMQENRYHNYLADYVELFGRDNVAALIQEQINSIDYVQRCVYTDSEGCTYNAIIWKEVA